MNCSCNNSPRDIYCGDKVVIYEVIYLMALQRFIFLVAFFFLSVVCEPSRK